jgi:DNA repair protein RecO (recombination protein O)
MEGLIYKVQPYQEHARLLFVYTKEGKKTLLAQGSQKVNHPSRILAQYLTHIEFKEGTKSFLTLAESKILNDFSKIKSDYHKTQSAAIILEIIDHLIVDEYQHDQIYDEMMQALSAPDISLSSLSFSLKILKPLGYAIDMNADGRKVKGLNIENGCLIYEGEQDIIDLDIKESISLLKLMFQPYLDLEPIELEILKKIKNFILKYYQYHLQSTLKNLQ